MSKPVLITLDKVYGVLLMSESILEKTVLRLKKDRSRYVKSHRTGSEIYSFSRSATQNFLHRSTMVADIFEDFEPPSKKFLATPLVIF